MLLHVVHVNITVFYRTIIKQLAPTDLVITDVVHNEVEPEPKPRVASIRADKQVVFVFRDQIHTSEVTCKETSN
jgi:hypothetical protein